MPKGNHAGLFRFGPGQQLIEFSPELGYFLGNGLGSLQFLLGEILVEECRTEQDIGRSQFWADLSGNHKNGLGDVNAMVAHSGGPLISTKV